ncbi:MAG: lysine--tRNA ligase [Dongiaceae bacterium]
MPNERDLALNARAWPFEEARKLLQRYKDAPPRKGYVLFETGYGPSGLPHIGTFGEVVRTTMVRQAFRRMSDLPTRLFAFSDDMDGLRKVPDNVPNKEMLTEHLGRPLTVIPDPFGCHESFGHHNNAMLRGFLDGFGFEYEFQSSTDWYRSGRFDAALRLVLEKYDEVMAVMLPSLREERAKSYSPFLPVSPKSGRVLQVPILEHHVERGTVVFEDEDGAKTELPVTGGHCKLQWKPDWAMRWYALGVDYEMSGKDLITSVELANKICRILGAEPPEGFNFELFLDEKGQKISKSKGNGLSVEEWLAYAPPESLALFMYSKPRAAKRLYFDAFPRAVDDYLTFIEKYQSEAPERKIENPVWHIHDGNPPQAVSPLTFGILLNLASVCNAADKETLWAFISRYAPGATPETAPFLDRLVGHALAFFRDFVRPAKKYRAPTAMERVALEDLRKVLDTFDASSDSEAIQFEIYEVGKRHDFPDLRSWFKALYEILLGEEQGPRMGTFAKLYGLDETKALIDRVLRGEDLSAA